MEGENNSGILKQIKDYLRVDYDEDDEQINALIEVSGLYIDSCVGEGYKNNTLGLKLALLLQKKIVKDLYDERGTKVSANTKADKITTTILDKLSNMG